MARAFLPVTRHGPVYYTFIIMLILDDLTDILRFYDHGRYTGAYNAKTAHNGLLIINFCENHQSYF